MRRSSCRRRKSAAKELPREIMETILERLPTRDAARCALLSTQWRAAWYSQGRLVFDWAFCCSITSMYKFNKASQDECFSVVSIINSILMLRSGPIRIFTLDYPGRLNDLCRAMPLPQANMDGWCVFLSKNGVEELDLSTSHPGHFKLPSCIVSCNTIKHLTLECFDFSLPVNAGCIFPGLLSAVFRRVWFRGNYDQGLVFSIPNLEKLAFDSCTGVTNFVIRAPKLKSLTLFRCVIRGNSIQSGLTLALILSNVKTLAICFSLSSDTAVSRGTDVTFQTAINLREGKLDSFNFGFEKHLIFVVELLKKTPRLCTLEINIQEGSREGDPALLEDLFKANFRMLEKLTLNRFHGSKMELCLVKLLLSKSPALQKVVIHGAQDINDSWALRAPEKFLSFPRASPKVHIVYNSWSTNP
ncbi:unnamed protein product [Cuscuta epithymum]|uniref:F-box domain-containing protein n=1 Tax=Cuscuta epithymum TaxID=186058 RepID=A0AAV0ELL2_9ASTE|nr:unnamed protein product [Cuscuta epithymum]CAH9124103.1 unnamed protein product [Cuscuta epithymum]